MTIKFPRLLRWGEKGLSAILDQGLFSGTNFVVNVLLARWLSPQDYGAFSVSFAIYLIILSFYIALILEPASVLGPADHAERLKPYIAGLFRLHFVLSPPISLLIAISAFIMFIIGFGKQSLALALIGNSISLTFMLLIWLVRRAFYILKKPEVAVLGSALYAAIFVGGILWIYQLGQLSLFSTYLIAGFAAFIGSVTPMIITRERLWVTRDERISWREVLSEQWRFGRWRTGASFLAITFGQIQMFLTAGFLGLEFAGVLRALQNFIQPMVQIEAAIESLGLPVISREYGKGNIEGVRRRSFFISSVLVIMAFAYLILLFLYAEPIAEIIYSGRYSSYIQLVRILGITPILLGGAMGFALQLLAIGKPQYYLIVYLVNAPISFILSVYLIMQYGLTGSVWSLVIPSIVTLPVVILLYYYWFPGVRRGKHDIKSTH